MWGLGRKKPQTQDKTTTWLFRHLLTWLDSFLVAEVNFLVFLSWKCLYSMLNINNRQSYFYILKANIIISKLSLAGNIYIQKCIRYMLSGTPNWFVYTFLQRYNWLHLAQRVLISCFIMKVWCIKKCFDWTILTWCNGKLVAWLWLNNRLNVKYSEFNLNNL